MEFAHFRGISIFHKILQNSVVVGDKGTNTAHFDGVRAAIHDFTMKHMTATRALMRGILKILS